jgi:membrane-bound lytic murein transglycosylase D
MSGRPVGNKIAGVLLCIFLSTLSYAGNMPVDTSGKVLLASLNKKDGRVIIIKEANVVFPDVLTGNDEQSIDYIEKFATNRREYIIRTYNKSKKYFPKAAAILKRYNLPHELKVLLALESAFKPNAVSKAGAVGYWQFMDEVGKEYGLKVVTQLSAEEKKKLVKKDKKKAEVYFKTLARQKDDRKNFNKSTHAAARYLKDRSRNLNNDLLLMVASYNCGIGNVWDAMEACGKTDPSFWDVKNYLPAETRAYVMNFIALNVIFNNYDKFANNSLTFKPVKINAENLSQHMNDDWDDSRNVIENNKD